MSEVVHALPSLQGAALFTWTQPVAGSQPSSVHTFPSSQSVVEPPTQSPPLHVSELVHAFPSVHAAELLTYAHPVAGSQLSSVHTFPSSQLGAAPPTQAPLEQVSPAVHASPSLHGAVLFTWAQPVAGSQLSSVHTLPSSQSGAGPPTQIPLAQVSLAVQASPSLQGAVLLTCAQPLAGSQLSSVQTLPSSQLGAGPTTQIPPAQVSPVVQESLSLQDTVLFRWTQPVAGSQPSSVHTFPSSQSVAGPTTQIPPAQVSLAVQASPSLQGAALFVWTQPTAGSQLSSVQAFPSSQFGPGPPTQTPPLQASSVVQASPSLQGTVLFPWTQPVAGSQPSFVHRFPSSQLRTAPLTQLPPEQVSPVVQASPSLHGAVLSA